MGEDWAVSDDRRPILKPNKISHANINDDCLGRQPANSKTGVEEVAEIFAIER